MVTASTPALSHGTVGTTDLLRFKAQATACTFSLCLMATRTLMDSLQLSRRAQLAAPLLACMTGLVFSTVLSLTTVPVWVATQARGVKMWWDAAGLQCPPMDPQRVCFITRGHASLSTVTLALSYGGFVPPSASVMAPGVRLPQSVYRWRVFVLYHPSQNRGITSWFMDPMTSSLPYSIFATSHMSSVAAPREPASLTIPGVGLLLFAPK